MPANTFHPANDNPKMDPGSMKNTMNKYTIANHLYSAVVLPSAFAILIGSRRSCGIGYHISIPLILKNKWHNAICRANLSSSHAKAANIPVAVVPIFEPNVKGYTLSKATIPRPTRGVRADVKIELD